MSEERDFKGVWIPKEIWLNTELTLLEKIIYTEIDSLDNENHCTAGNEYFAEFCNCSESKVSKAISKLQDLNMIKILSFDGRHRKICIIKSIRQTNKKYEADYDKVISINIDNNQINKKKELLISKDINNSQKVEEIKNLYNSHCTNLPKIAKLTDKRIKAIGSLLKKYSIEEITQVFDIANESDFLMGKNDRGWKADLDFILREDKFINILEGKYGGHRKINRISSDMGRTANRMTDDQKKQFKEDIKNDRAEKY
jgi:DNA-binding transcriptional regulator GbsR (MarR family)